MSHARHRPKTLGPVWRSPRPTELWITTAEPWTPEETDMMWNVGRRRTTRAMLGLAAGVLALAACRRCSGTSGSQPSTIAAHKPGEKVELTFWSWVPGVDKAVALWNQQNPEVQVKLEKIPAGSSGGYAKMHSALKAGSGAPDLAQVEYQEIPGFLLEKGLVDLSPYGASADKDKFVDWQWQQGAFGGGRLRDPSSIGPDGLVLPRRPLPEMGHRSAQDSDDFRTAAKTIRQKDPKAYISTFPPGNSAWFTALAWQAGGSWFGSEGDTWTVNMDNPQTQKVAGATGTPWSRTT